MIRRAPLVVLSVAAFSGCQGYKVQPVIPGTTQVVNQHNVGATLSAPNVMIVQDLSGSMCEPIQEPAPNGMSCLATAGGPGVQGYCSVCSPGGGACTDPADCDSKLQLVAANMASALAGLKIQRGQLNLGLASFGTLSQADQCATGQIQVPIGDAVSTIPLIDQFYQSAAAGGGTPTAATLAVAAKDNGLQDPTARNFIFLVTDGYPNCEATSACTSEAWTNTNGQSFGCASPANVTAANPTLTNPQPPADCACSFGACAAAGGVDCCPIANGSPEEAWYCLDDQGTDGELASLYTNQKITTDVVGMGYDFGSNSNVLQQMAASGHGTLYTAKTPAQLTAAITALLGGTGQGCTYTLDAVPKSADLISVSFNNQLLVAGDANGYVFEPPQTVVIQGTPCDDLEAGAPAGELQITAIGN